jgi:hypothetical protein
MYGYIPVLVVFSSRKKKFGCHIGYIGIMLGGVFDTNKKTNYRTYQETAR